MRDPLLPPQPLSGPDPALRSLASREKSAVREAIANAVEGGAVKLAERLEEVYLDDGARVYLETFIKVLEFVQPKLQRVTVQDPEGNALPAPVINVSFAPAPGAHITINSAPHEDPLTIIAEEIPEPSPTLPGRVRALDEPTEPAQ